MPAPSKLLVDGNCIVCDFEASHYKRIAPTEFEIIDISRPDFDAAKYGLTAEAVNKSMHAIDSDGKLYVGVDAFAHIWSRIPKYVLASKLIALPVIHPTAKIGYRLFASFIRPRLPKKNRAKKNR